MQTSKYYKSIELDECSSTNLYSSEQIKEGIITENSVVMTLDQTNGRGKRSNKWESEKGKNVTISINYFPKDLSVSNSYIFYMISSISIVRVIMDILDRNVYSDESIDIESSENKIKHIGTSNQDLKIKWPNDIYYKDHKLGGILSESILEGIQVKSIICGIGLNINQSVFDTPGAISLYNIVKQEFDTKEIIHQISENFFSICNDLFSNQISYNQVQSEYVSNLYYHQKPRFFRVGDDTFMGTIVGISTEGQLIIKDSDNNISYHTTGNIEYIESVI